MQENYFMGLDGFVWFTGVVEDRKDPAQLGRVRVRCLGWHTEDLNDIPTNSLPWAHIMHPTTDPSMQGLGNTPSFLVEGTWVVGFFLDAVEKQQPLIIGTLPGKPQESQMIIFPGWLHHEVPTHTCDHERIMIAGNLVSL